MTRYGDVGHCPKCGRFCGNIMGEISEAEGLSKVEGVCKVHGTVDLTGQSWAVEDFEHEEGEE